MATWVLPPEANARQIVYEVYRELKNETPSLDTVLMRPPEQEVRAALIELWKLLAASGEKASGRVEFDFANLLGDLRRAGHGLPSAYHALIRLVEDKVAVARRLTEEERGQGRQGLLALAVSMSKALRFFDRLDEGESDTSGPAIPLPCRSRPLGMAEAAKLMGYRGTKKAAAKRLKSAIDSGAIRCIRINRQTYVFDTKSFPPEALPRVRP